MSAILLKNITVDGTEKDILIEKGLISRIEPAGNSKLWILAGDVETMNCQGKVAIPGFVNMHTHTPMSLMRGIGEDMIFRDWLKKIWEVEEKIDWDFVYWGSKVSCLEMIRTGTTTFNDHYWFFPATYKAATEMGIRPALGFDAIDHNDPEKAVRQMEQCERYFEQIREWNKNAIYEVAFHAIYSVSEDLMIYINNFAQKHDLNLHIHLCETQGEVEDCKKAHGGLTPVEYLESIGLLSPRLLAAHTLWLSEHDIELLAKYKVNCIHNINSNTKLSSGYKFLYNELRDAGVNVTIGTDGCASSNNLDMLEAMKTSAIFQKAWRKDPSALPLPELLAMATVNGAKALRFNGGVIKEGAVADISIIETNNTFFLSNGDFLANLIYSAHSDCIDSVIAGGKFVMRHREIKGEEEIIAEARKVLSKIA